MTPVCSELAREVDESPVPLSYTHCAQMFPQWIYANIYGANVARPAPRRASSIADYSCPQREYATSVWTIVECFGSKDLIEKLNDTGFRGFENAMTLDPNIRNFFNNQELWFEAVVSDFEFSALVR